MFEIAQIYRKTFGQAHINATSCLLVHYPLYLNANAFYATDIGALGISENFAKHYYCSPSFPYDYWHIANAFYNTSHTVTLLTGDAEITASLERRLFRAVPTLQTQNCGFLQVPHHGAKKEWLTLQKRSIKADVYAIPFGLGNSYNHPSTTAIDDMEQNKLRYFLANQRQYFLYYIS